MGKCRVQKVKYVHFYSIEERILLQSRFLIQKRQPCGTKSSVSVAVFRQKLNNHLSRILEMKILHVVVKNFKQHGMVSN
jgi:hypothetical protein